MPISFLEAKARVSPDKPVQPGSPEHLEIMELMRQSGHVFAEDNAPEPMPPAKTWRDLVLFRERTTPTPVAAPVSKRDWLKLPSNRDAYIEHLVANRIEESPGRKPDHLSWAGKTPSSTPGLSKRQWISSLV